MREGNYSILILAQWQEIGFMEKTHPRTFNLVLFAVGNSGSPELMWPPILLFQTWATATTAEKRARHTDFTDNNWEPKKKYQWFYYDINTHKLQFLNSSSKSKQNVSIDINYCYRTISDKTAVNLLTIRYIEQNPLARRKPLWKLRY